MIKEIACSNKNKMQFINGYLERCKGIKRL